MKSIFNRDEKGKRIKEGALQRREFEKEKLKLNKKPSQLGSGKIEAKDDGNVGVFEKHTKLLKKIGYTGGGLGKNAQGIVASIEAKSRPKNMEIRFNDYKEAANAPALQEEEKKALPKPSGIQLKEKLWSKHDKSKKKKKDYITAKLLLVKKQEQGIEVVQKVFDMRGPQVRVLTNLDNLNAEQFLRENNIPMPELQHNIRLIFDLVELDIQKIDQNLKNKRETVVSLQKEKKKLKDDAARQKISTRNDLLSVQGFLRMKPYPNDMESENDSRNSNPRMKFNKWEELAEELMR
nr:septin and tuftelin-interacting protein 1 homolog 1 [Tanacetum cinerariifolium]